MIVRLITYHAVPGKDVEGWLRGACEDMRRVPGMQRVEFVRSVSDPSRYGAVMYFQNREDLDRYKATPAYRQFVESTRELWLDASRPVEEQVLEVLDI